MASRPSQRASTAMALDGLRVIRTLVLSMFNRLLRHYFITIQTEEQLTYKIHKKWTFSSSCHVNGGDWEITATTTTPKTWYRRLCKELM